MLRRLILEEFGRRNGSYLSIADISRILQPDLSSKDFIAPSQQRLLSRQRVLLSRRIRYHIDIMVRNKEIDMIFDPETKCMKFASRTRAYQLQGASEPHVKFSVGWFASLENFEQALLATAPTLQEPLHIDDANRLVQEKERALELLKKVSHVLPKHAPVVLHFNAQFAKDFQLCDFLGAVACESIRVVIEIPARHIIMHHSMLVSLANLPISHYISFTLGKSEDTTTFL